MCTGPLSVCDAPPGAHALLIIFPDQFAQPSEYEQLAFAIQVPFLALVKLSGVLIMSRVPSF